MSNEQKQNKMENLNNIFSTSRRISFSKSQTIYQVTTKSERQFEVFKCEGGWQVVEMKGVNEIYFTSQPTKKECYKFINDNA